MDDDRTWREIVVMILFATLGLGFPDIDHLFLSWLHHRSIVTHSVLIPLPFLLARNEAVRAGAAGFLVGVSIHLAADILSPAKGFGTVWLPWPIKASLGPLSPMWIAANSGVAMVCSLHAMQGLKLRHATGIFGLLSFGLAAAYATLHERKGMAFLAFLVVFVLAFAFEWWMARQRRSATAEARDREAR
ncbi:hypothetical protein [Allostella humosa]|nr:hypothetical protein [Stella humosa]